MKKLALQFIVTLVAIGVALAAYDFLLRRADMTEARTQTAALKKQTAILLETTQSQTKQLARQAKALGDQSKALKAEVEAERLEAADQRARAMVAPYLAQGMTAAGRAKVAITEYYYSRGEPPASNHDAGLAEPEQYKGDSLRRMDVSKGGVITLVYDKKSGVDNGTIQLIPDITHAAAQLNWRCVSPDFTHIAIVLPSCQYVAASDEAPASD